MKTKYTFLITSLRPIEPHPKNWKKILLEIRFSGTLYDSGTEEEELK